MRLGRGGAALALLFISATLGTCVYPTERDAGVFVKVTPIRVLLRGSEAVATASAWQRGTAGDSQPVPNVKFVWSSSNPLIATVDNAGHIVGVKSGTVIITAAAANFDAARVGTDTLRVSAALEIDSVRPKTIKYGEMLRIYGVGVDSILQAKLGNADLFKVPFSDIDYRNGTALSLYWVPPPAVTDSLFFLGIFGGSGVFGFVHDTTHVLEHDLYDPNVTTPQRVSLDGPGPFPGTPFSFLLFFNPALAFEGLPRGVKSSADWFRFTQSTARDLTFILESPTLKGTFSTFLSDSLGWTAAKGYFIGRDSWTYGPGSHACHGLPFAPPEGAADSTIVAFKQLPAASLDAIAVYTQPGRYGLHVINGYVSELPADAHEDDNSCTAADARGTALLPFRDTLAIENPHDIDWIRFRVPSPAPLLGVQVRVHAFPGAVPDTAKFLDLYVIKVPSPGDLALSVVLADTNVVARTEHDQTLLGLAAGADYYAVVLDFAGETTNYEICVAAAGGCNALWPAPPAAAAAAVAGSTSPPVPARARGTRPPRRGGAPRVAPRLNLGRQ